MGLSMSYLKRAMAATVARWTESLQLRNKALQVHDAPREFMEDVCGAPGEFVEDDSDRDREILRKLRKRINKTAKRLKKKEHLYRELREMTAKREELWAMIDKHGPDWGTGPRF